MAQLVLVGTLFLVTLLRPYRDAVDNYLQMTSLAGSNFCPCFSHLHTSAFRILWGCFPA